MLHEVLALYLQQVEAAFLTCKMAFIEKYEEEILTPERVNLRIKVRFASGHLLEINEAVIVEAEIFKTLDYRYHFQEENNQLILRYDSTPHFPDLPSFPHHKHYLNEVIACKKPDLLDVLAEVQLWLDNQN